MFWEDAVVAQLVERVLGKDEVTSSILVNGSSLSHTRRKINRMPNLAFPKHQPLARREPLRLRSDRLTTPIGELIVLTDHENKIRVIEWVDHEHRILRSLLLQYGPHGFTIEPEQENSSSHIAALRAYFEGDLNAIDTLPVETAGTSFQRSVWRALRGIPGGETISYAQLARHIGHPAAVRAVGLANGANPVSIVVPCHRVIGANGSLTGYGGGVERKHWLLTHEGASPNRSLFSIR